MSIKGKRKVREGVVRSAKMSKTIVVDVVRLVKHPLYKRIVRKTSTFKAHDEKQECGPGDTVRIIETKPISKTKRWRLLEIVERSKVS